MDSDEVMLLGGSLLVAIVETEKRIDELRERHEKLQEITARFPNSVNRQKERELRTLRTELSVRLNELNRQLRLQRSVASKARNSAVSQLEADSTTS